MTHPVNDGYQIEEIAQTEQETCMDLFKETWEDYPSQDNEGHLPDRGGFKCGWFAAWSHKQKEIDSLEYKLKNKDELIKASEEYIDDLRKLISRRI